MKKVKAAKNYLNIIEITIVQLIGYLFLVSVSTLLIVNSILSFEYIELQFISGLLTLLLSIVYVVYCLYRNKKDKEYEEERKIAFYNSPEQVAIREEFEKRRLLKKENVEKEKEYLQIQAQIEREKQSVLFEKERLEQFAKLKIKQEEEERIEEEAYQERVRQQEEARQIERDNRKEAERQLIDELQEAYEKRKALSKK